MPPPFIEYERRLRWADADAAGRLHFPRIFEIVEEAEADLLRGLDVETLVVKRGARGCVVIREGRFEEHAALPAGVVDTTGAGDAFAAGFLVGGPDLALRAAARCVARMGAMP